MRYEDFVLHLDSGSRGFRARVLKSPFGEGAVGFSLPETAGAEPAIHGGTTRDVARHGTAPSGGRPPLEIGNDLFRTVFQGQVRTLLDKSLGQVERSPDLGLRLKIKLDPNDEDAGALADLPWELLCDVETEDFFALSRQMSVVRYLDVPRSSQPIPFTPPLRILAVGASPRNLDALDLDEEKERLEKLNQSSSGVEVQFLLHASAGAVRERLAKDTFNVLHFMGHGAFDSTTGEGMLAFEAPDGSMDLVSGKAFATKLKDLRSLGVVVLNACETARAQHRQGSSPFRGVANALVLGGLPAVVAMQRPISDLAAIRFSTAFYRNLAQGDSIDEALTEGRQAVHSARPEDYEWSTPVLFLRIPDGTVFVPRAASPPQVLPPEEKPVVVFSEPAPASQAKRATLFKAAAGVAGAALAVFVVSTQLKPSGEPNHPSSTDSRLGASLTTALEPAPVETPAPGHAKGTTKPSARKDEPETVVERRPAPASTPAPVEESPKEIVETVAADVSNLSAEVLSAERQGDELLRVTILFRNHADGPLSAVLDANGVLSDDKFGRYNIMDSDLPFVDSNPRLNLGATDSARHTFDFQAPPFGVTKVNVFLSSQEGKRIKVSGSPKTITGSP
ncbi:MAG: CHAT domain-containing protein [Acidobacteriota bacterium]